MIHAEHVAHLERFSRYYLPTLCMLGAQGSTIDGYPTARAYFRQWVGPHYVELDTDGGDLALDLNRDHHEPRRFGCVFNFGTLEHVWNVHAAWCNALRMVDVGGYFVTHSPVTGWPNHGLHTTSALAIRAFLTRNGFEVADEVTVPWRKQGDVLWLAAKKRRHIESAADYEPPVQLYENGVKIGVQ